MEVSPLHVQLGAHHFNLRAEAGPTGRNRFPLLYQTKKETRAEIDEQHEGFWAHADDVVIKQYESLRHCVLFILIEE